MTTTTDLPINLDHEKIAVFCRTRGIRPLSLFGSVLRDDFDPVRSDGDVLAEFKPGALKGVGFRYMRYNMAQSIASRSRLSGVCRDETAFSTRNSEPLQFVIAESYPG
ncbi:MAG: hypothetical protein R6V45_07100 [Oceanipulchritudo sp.]